MRYEGMKNLLRLAMQLKGRRSGMTLDDIRETFEVSRRTAERMRDAVEAAFGQMEHVTDDNKRRWTLPSSSLRDFVDISAEDVTELESAADTLERAGLDERAALLRNLADTLRAALPAQVGRRLETDVEALMEAEGLAMRPGPRPRLARELFKVLRNAIKACRVVTFRYHNRSTGRDRRRRVHPYGLLYGNRAFLVGPSPGKRDVALWRLSSISAPRITDDSFERDPAFDLQRYAKQSFGVFQETPVTVVLRFTADAAPDAATFLFHPNQTVTRNRNGSLTVRFTAGGINEICWHLFTWGTGVTIERPTTLRHTLATMCKEMEKHHAG